MHLDYLFAITFAEQACYLYSSKQISLHPRRRFELQDTLLEPITCSIMTGTPHLAIRREQEMQRGLHKELENT